MNEANEVYNSHFLLEQDSHPDFPDGWVQTGGDKTTKWEWLGQLEGPRSVKVEHTLGPRAGITQGNDVIIPAGEGQRWEIRAVLQAEPAEVQCYMLAYLGAVSQYLFTVRPSMDPAAYNKVFSTTSGVTGLRLEVGILGEGTIIIHEIQGRRLYPEQLLRLDEKGQLYVRHVDSIGKIQAPVPVNLLGPLPIPVDVKTPLKTEFRDLTPSRNGVKIYGSNGNPIISTSDGLIKTVTAGRKYLQYSEELIANNISASTNPIDVSQISVYSYAVYNTGEQAITVQMEISPDGITWTADDLEQEILPGVLEVLTINHFLLYVRLAYRSPFPNPFKFWFQAQY